MSEKISLDSSVPDYIVSHNNIIKNPRSDPGCRFPSIFADVVLSTST